MQYNTLLIHSEPDIIHVQLNRQEAMNTINQEMVDELYACFAEIDKNQEVRAVVLSGKGRAFCAGGDVSFLKAISKQSHLETRNHLNDLFDKLTFLTRVRKPIIGALHGYALGAGFGLSLLCDMRIAAESTTFGAEFPMMGIIPEIGCSHMLPLLAGLGRAMELVLTARRFNALEAERIGLVNSVVNDDTVLDTAFDLARRICGLPPLAVGLSKAALRQGAVSTLQDSVAFEANINAFCYKTEDHKEAASAFLEKRKPAFTGR